MAKRVKIILGAVVMVIVAVVVVYTSKRPATPASPVTNQRSEKELIQQGETSMQLTSPVFQHNQAIPSKYTCDGQDINPPLALAGVPPAAKSLVLVVDDPDAPRGDWVHWTVWNIKPETASIAENFVPAGASEGMTDFGRPGWGGPCPPSGIHHYQFKLYALDTELSLPTSARKPDIEAAIEGHILEQTALVGLYQRQ